MECSAHPNEPCAKTPIHGRRGRGVFRSFLFAVSRAGSPRSSSATIVSFKRLEINHGGVTREKKSSTTGRRTDGFFETVRSARSGRRRRLRIVIIIIDSNGRRQRSPLARRTIPALHTRIPFFVFFFLLSRH